MLDVYKGKRILVTGHTGFKGAWLTLWLKELGAHVMGYSLDVTRPSLFETLKIENQIEHTIGDCRSFQTVWEAFQKFQPEIVFHLAAQALVLPSFQDPKETFETNVQGTLNVLECMRKSDCVKASVIVTTDKCYRNKEWEFGYRENDELGGADPYSASKAMAELLVASYRSSFFSEKDRPLIATARAGNVIGGGDFSPYRILPDCLRALSKKEAIEVRAPDSVRPWLHVLDPLRGYLLLGLALYQGKAQFATSWNFGPPPSNSVPVKQLVEETISLFGEGSWKEVSNFCKKKEMKLLRLSFEKAYQNLSWSPHYDWKEAVKKTVLWFQAFLEGKDMNAFSKEHLREYSHAVF